ncbi:rab3 GTPase-activating protein catalytic protein isoform X2 [Wolffia australiana]
MDLGMPVFEDQEEEIIGEVEAFDDFTVASSWERFISDIETVCRSWMADGPRNLLEKGAESVPSLKDIFKVKCELKYGSKVYCLEYYFQTTFRAEKFAEWSADLHNLQLMFGVKEFMVIAPASASGVVLDVPVASKLLSSITIALSNCGSICPAFVPVHDPTREAFFGIQNMGTNFTRRFDADCMRSQVPIRLMHLEGLYQLFLSKFGIQMTDFSASLFNVKLMMKLTYMTPEFDADDDIDVIQEEEITSSGKSTGLTNAKSVWDDDCPWSSWYSAEDPIKGFKLCTIWSERTVSDSLEMAEIENALVLDAEKWSITPILQPNLTDDSLGHMIGFSSQLASLIKALDASLDAKFVEDLTTDGKPAYLPAPSVLDRLMKEIFREVHQAPEKQEDYFTVSAIKGAPLESLFGQFCLNALWFGNCNIQAIALLWIEFVREVRWYWEESQALPRTLAGRKIDLSACLIHQKLQMLAICIEKKGDKLDVGSISNVPDIEKIQLKGMDIHKDNESLPSLAHLRMGSSSIVGNMMLLQSPQSMHAPHMQDPPIMTEDMHEERLQAVEALGDEFIFSGQLEKEMLASDMSAFKAANPEAIFEDFIRWHSPADWESIQNEDNCSLMTGSSKDDWPPQGRLSARMSEPENSWKLLWDESPPLPASQQKPLLDPIREGEKIIHYLETLRPRVLLEQMICTAFKASLDTLSLTHGGDFKQMTSKIEQLYKTVSTGLKTLRGNKMNDKDELISDLLRLSSVFEHVEKMLLFSTSIHMKLRESRRLSEAIFCDFYDFYLPKMGTGFSSICYDESFKSEQLVRTTEREAVLGLFPPPSANQSWRKVLSMGNLLNGHEPLTRELIFLAYGGATHATYGSSAVTYSKPDVETHRMYVRGTSNDLKVALSVTSWD